MKDILKLLVIFFSFTTVNSQIILSNDTTICSVQPFQLAAVSSTLDSLSTDDVYTGVQDIGFDFEFYGITYSKLLVSSNGYVTFDTTNASAWSIWGINAAIPNAGTEPENAIMCPWHDTDPNIGGVVYYGSFGIAPNRIYIVTWCALPMYSSLCNSLISTSQLLLYEGSNKIEMQIQDKPLCITHNGGAAIQGLVDATSTNFDIVTDPILGLPRNFPLTWATTNEGWEFLPNGPTGYTINQIPFQIPAVGTTTWHNELGDSIGSGPYFNVNPTSTTTYYAEMPVSCSGGSYSDSVTITINPSFNVSTSLVHTSCLGNDGSVTIYPNLSQTSPPWNFELVDLAGNILQTANLVTTSSHTFPNLVPGNYIVRVFDSGGCSNQENITISQLVNPFSVSVSVNDVNCYNGTDGRVSIDAQNAPLPYQYFLNGNLNTNPYPGDSIFDGLSAGTYVVTILDDNSCAFRDTVYVTEPSIPLQALTSSKQVLCHQDSLGFASVVAVGGSSPYSYEWHSSNGSLVSTDDTASSLLGGLYFVEVTDVNGCDTVGSVNLLTPNTAIFSSTEIGEVICKGDPSGYIVGDAGGGFAPYTYTWSTSLGGVIQTTSGSYNTDTLHSVSSGIYLLDIVDHYGCSVSQSSLTVNEPLTALSIDTLYLIDSVYCYGDNDGRSLAVVSGGDPSYVYSWDNGESTLLATSLTGGYHIFSVVDERGCEVFDSIYIPESSEIISTLLVEESVECYGSTNGIVSVSTYGGYADYIYSWSNGQPLDTGFVDTAYNLSYGVYALTTEDSLGCSVVDSIFMYEPDLLTMESHEVSWISCFGADDGLASSSAQGGTEPYTFVWDNNQIGDTVNTLTPGLHTVVVTDARGCTASDTVTIHQPDVLTVSISVLDSVYCNGMSTGSLKANPLGGTPFTSTSYSYTYLWDDALQASQTTQIATNLAADIYTVVVTDIRGCTAIATADITTVTNTMSLTASHTDVSCYGSLDGTASVSVTGVPPQYASYSYNWVGNNGSTLATSPSVQGLSAGTYSVTVSDVNNCTRNTSVDIVEPLPIVYNISGSDDEYCVGACDGEIFIDTLSGGTPPYSALLTNITTGITTSHSITAASILDVCSGDYTVELTNQDGCSSSVIAGGNNQAQLTATIASLPTPSVSLLNNVLCNGDSTGALEVLSPNVNYTYYWEDVNNPGVSLGSGVTVTGLPLGDYVVYLEYTDSLGVVLSGCDVGSAVESISEPDSISILESSHLDILCNGDNTGALSVQVSGGTPGTPPYTYTWTPNQTTNATIANLTAGTYVLEVEDGNNCTQTSSFDISEPSSISVSISQGTNTYVLTATQTTGGTAPYSYSWREQTSPSVHLQGGTTYNVYAPGTYYLVVEDANGCEVQSNSFTYTSSPTSVVDVTSEIDLNIYPNPFKDETTVDFGTEIKQATITIVDVYGKLIETYNVNNQQTQVITRNNKASGVYFLEIEMEEGKSIIKKLIID